jgi:hypothetical protein
MLYFTNSGCADVQFIQYNNNFHFIIIIENSYRQYSYQHDNINKLNFPGNKSVYIAFQCKMSTIGQFGNNSYSITIYITVNYNYSNTWKNSCAKIAIIIFL